MGISIWQLLIILVIVLVLFGAKRLRNIGSDLGASVKGFREAMRDGQKSEPEEDNKEEEEDRKLGQPEARIIDAEVSNTAKENHKS